MAICYDRLFHLMIDKKIGNAQLKEKAGFCFFIGHRETSEEIYPSLYAAVE